jgi:SecD/SecF fusion protein
LHRALDEGYSRALTTIIDANMTSIITAVFLYVYGSGAIRGFAVSLTLGLLISMFTAVYVTRAVFEWQLKRGSLREISRLGRARVPTIRWMSLRHVLVPISVAAVVLGFVAYFSVDRYTLYDVDFTGGQKVQIGFSAPTSVEEVKSRLAGEPVAVEVIQVSKDKDGQNLVRRRTTQAGPYPDAEVYAVRSLEGANKVELKIQRASETETLTPQEETQALEGFLRARFADRLLPPWTSGDPKPYTGEGLPAPTAPEPVAPGLPLPPAPEAGAGSGLKDVVGGWQFDLSFVDPAGVLTKELLTDLLVNDFPHSRTEAGERKNVPSNLVRRKVVVEAAPVSQPGVRTYLIWLKTLPLEGEAAAETPIDTKDPAELRRYVGEWFGSNDFKDALGKRIGSRERAEDVGLSAAFPSQDQISPTVAEALRNDALIALLLSFFGIIVYVAFRFHSQSMGIASVLCLVHDVIVTAGVVAVANLTGLVDAQINLTMVAAFLTIVVI